MRSVLCASLVVFAGAPRQTPPAPGPAVERAPAVEGFLYAPGRIPVGRVHRYRKTNLDGTNPTEIALFLGSETGIEALKWSPGEPEATLVVAEMDWHVCSVWSFHTYKLDEHGTRALVAELETTPDRKSIVGRLGATKLVCPVERFPWHSYDFDFASLNVALRFLVDPEGETEFTVIDPVHEKGVDGLAAKGTVVLAYEGREERAGVPCRRYVLDGPGLEDRGGSLWASAGDEVFLVAFELDLPDEPGMRSGKLEWLRNETMASDEWERFVRERKEPAPR